MPRRLRGGTRDSCAQGRELHRRVPAERWCVTRDDLDTFVATVRERHRRGAIPNDPDPATGIRNPHHEDPAIGPNLHAVNRYVISPLTLASGGMSWALMLREEGLPVDFFITHSWQEGIYEFHTKVAESWPPGARHAWCCFLANPQPWDRADLKELLGSQPDLSDSPFARALNAPTCQMLLAVPNVTESIYARLWCVEEARRAICRGLPVWLATDRGILHWPLRCTSVAEATDALSRNRLRRSRALSEQDVGAMEDAEGQLAARFVTVRRARCSDPDDERRILAWISGRELEIDGMIRRLAKQGQWLPERAPEEEEEEELGRPCGGAGGAASRTPQGRCSLTSPGLASPSTAGCGSAELGTPSSRDSLGTDAASSGRSPPWRASPACRQLSPLGDGGPNLASPLRVQPASPLFRTDTSFVESN